MRQKTSWENVAGWYDSITGEKGHYYHKKVIFPKLLKFLDLTKKSKILDLGCGQGILARSLPENLSYVGVDNSSSLIKKAKSLTKNKNHQFLHGDVCKKITALQNFTHAIFLLSLQNMQEPQKALKNVFSHLGTTGKLCLVVNHPCFRIARQTSWEIDKKNNLQYRRVNLYHSTLKIPIQMHPGKKKSIVTWTYHYSLETLLGFLFSTGFCITKLEEWYSDKKSTGKNAKRENRSRKEFPLFLTILAEKKGIL